MKKRVYLILFITIFITACSGPKQPAASAQPVEIKLMMIGNMYIEPEVYRSGFSPKGIPTNYDHLFANILSDIGEADIKIINQTTPLGGKELGLSGYPNFNSPQELGDSIVKAGFNVVLHASNHFLDKSLAGAQATIDYWHNQHSEIACLGINNTAETADNIYVYEKEGFKVAILNYTSETNNEIPADKPYIINLLRDEAKVRATIKKAHNMADIVIVCPNWGSKYEFTPEEVQKNWTHLFLEEKVDLVIGTHPQVLENVEKLTSSDGHEMIVYYSLGNFVSSQNYIPRVLSGMAKVTLVKEGDKSYIKAHEIEVLINHRATDNTFTTYKLSDYTDDLLTRNALNSDHAVPCENNCWCGASILGIPTHGVSNFNIAYCQKLCRHILGDMYKA